MVGTLIPEICVQEHPAPVAADDPSLIPEDEAAPESDAEYNSDAGADLTNMSAWIEGGDLDTLVIAFDFVRLILSHVLPAGPRGRS